MNDNDKIREEAKRFGFNWGTDVSIHTGTDAPLEAKNKEREELAQHPSLNLDKKEFYFDNDYADVKIRTEPAKGEHTFAAFIKAEGGEKPLSPTADLLWETLKDGKEITKKQYEEG